MSNIAFTVQRLSDGYYLAGNGAFSSPGGFNSSDFQDLNSIGIDGCYWIIADANSWTNQSSAISQVIEQLDTFGPGGSYSWNHVLYRVYAVTSAEI